MKLRVIAVCTLLLLAALPTFALPLCEECNYEWNSCEAVPGSFERCTYDSSTGLCYTYPGRCSTPFATPVLTEWNVASIEITRPSQDSVTITAPAVAEVPTATEQK
ncbi:MAG TPA: hypothetical protein VF911_09915 [Thermoanaerobaculia bacterium]|jgi:hypothetical protein